MINNTKVKQEGVVYTPDYIVKMVLDEAGYTSGNLLQKHVIDNSCGDGAFLKEIVRRYIEEFYKKENNLFSKDELKNQLQTYIHGLEIDFNETQKAKSNLNKILFENGIEDVEWDIKSDDTLKNEDYFSMMDFVVGNPPYVRIHNFKENYEVIKKSKFNQNGMTDLFILFYDIGIQMLNDNGKLTYITPSSIFNSLAGEEFRRYCIKNNILSKIIDLKHHQPFKNITTYTAIISLNKVKSDNLTDYKVLDNNLNPRLISKLRSKDFFIDKKYYFAEKDKLTEFKKIIDTDIKNKDIQVKNGFATLADSVFLQKKFEFDSRYKKKCLKVSTMTWYEMLFPYENGTVVDFDDFEEPLKKYLLGHKDKLETRSLDKNTKWYAFGRTQAINDFEVEKIAINSLYKNIENIKIKKLNSGEGAYSGLYITGEVELDLVNKILKNEAFLDYVSMLGKYKSGGYYTLSTSDLKKFIIYKLSEGKIWMKNFY